MAGQRKTRSSVLTRPADATALLVKTDRTGKVLWRRAFTGRGDRQVLWIEQTDDGGYILAGYTTVEGETGTRPPLFPRRAGHLSSCRQHLMRSCPEGFAVRTRLR